MEWKIGEIKQVNGEWYQCVEGNGCENCAFKGRKCYLEGRSYDPIGECCYDRRGDNKNVIFKKLEKVGEPFTCNYYGDTILITMQEYQLFNINVTNNDNTPMYISDYKHKRIAIEIKQNKENMEEKELNLKPFDLEAAKRDKPVCTRDGRKARIICFDRTLSRDGYTYPIVALVKDKNDEVLYAYTEEGLLEKYEEHDCDLMMLPEKKEGWVNIYKNNVYDTESKARESHIESGYIGTQK